MQCIFIVTMNFNRHLNVSPQFFHWSCQPYYINYFTCQLCFCWTHRHCVLFLWLPRNQWVQIFNPKTWYFLLVFGPEAIWQICLLIFLWIDNPNIRQVTQTSSHVIGCLLSIIHFICSTLAIKEWIILSILVILTWNHSSSSMFTI